MIPLLLFGTLPSGLAEDTNIIAANHSLVLGELYETNYLLLGWKSV